MTEQEYAEIFCESVDTIVKKAIENLPFDITIKCIIEKERVKNKEKFYIVSHSGKKYEARAINNSNFNIGDYVYVLVPNNDFSETKIILTKI